MNTKILTICLLVTVLPAAQANEETESFWQCNKTPDQYPRIVMNQSSNWTKAIVNETHGLLEQVDFVLQEVDHAAKDGIAKASCEISKAPETIGREGHGVVTFVDATLGGDLKCHTGEIWCTYEANADIRTANCRTVHRVWENDPDKDWISCQHFYAMGHLQGFLQCSTERPDDPGCAEDHASQMVTDYDTGLVTYLMETDPWFGQALRDTRTSAEEMIDWLVS